MKRISLLALYRLAGSPDKREIISAISFVRMYEARQIGLTIDDALFWRRLYGAYDWPQKVRLQFAIVRMILLAKDDAEELFTVQIWSH